MIIVLDGVNYGGKTILSKELHAHAEAVTDRPWLLLNSWSGAPYMKDMALNPEVTESQRFQMAQMARTETTRLVRHARRNNPDIAGVILDRWYLSSVVHQGLPLRDVVYDSATRDMLVPTVTHILPTPLREVLRRAESKERGPDDDYWYSVVSKRIAEVHKQYADLILQVPHTDNPFTFIEENFKHGHCITP